VIEAGFSAVYQFDLTDQLVVRRRTWRWFVNHLGGLIARDTPTATMWNTSSTTATPAGGLSPEGVGRLLDSWAN